MNIVPIILSGGSGTRLWPLSRASSPKQFISINAQQQSLFQSTLLRLPQLTDALPIIICNAKHQLIVTQQMKAVQSQASQIILEPEGKNTAPAIAIAAMLALSKGQDPIFLVLPSDHLLNDMPYFREKVAHAVEQAQNGKLVTFGITCSKPETAYGYILRGRQLKEDGVFEVAQFIEKPDLKTAEHYLSTGEYYWNSGMFVLRASTYLAELQSYAPDIYDAVQNTLLESKIDELCIDLNAGAFSECPANSIDYAVMEKTADAVVIPLSLNWSDVGSWAALWDASEQGQAGNVLRGDVLCEQTHKSYVHAQHRLVVALGMEDTIIVETDDVVLVAHKNYAQAVKDIVSKLKQDGRENLIN